MFQYFIIIIVVVHLCSYLILLKRREHIVVDYWIFTLVTTNVIWYFLMYPFAGDELNSIAVGSAINGIQKHLDEAFELMLIGYISMWCGKYFYDYNYKYKRDYHLDYLGKCFNLVYTHRKIRKLLIFIYLPFILFCVYQGFVHFGRDSREVLGVNGITRMIYNIAYSILPLIICTYIFLYLDTKKRRLFKYIIMFIGLSLFLSSRGLIFAPIALLLLFICINWGEKISFLKLLSSCCIILIGVFALGFLRGGRIDSFGMDSLLNDLLYGNTFSDLRDFSWILSHWNGEYFYGKTYIAGLISFFPSSISDFRQEWGIGRVTLDIVGMLDNERFHGGLRGTIFFESLLNFGIIGIIFNSFIYGYVVQFVNKRVVYYARKGCFMKAYSSTMIHFVVSLLMISSSAFKFYIIFIPIIALCKCRKQN